MRFGDGSSIEAPCRDRHSACGAAGPCHGSRGWPRLCKLPLFALDHPTRCRVPNCPQDGVWPGSPTGHDSRINGDGCSSYRGTPRYGRTSSIRNRFRADAALGGIARLPAQLAGVCLRRRHPNPIYQPPLETWCGGRCLARTACCHQRMVGRAPPKP